MNSSNRLPAKLRLSKKLTLNSLLLLVALYSASGLLAVTINWTTLLVPCLTLLVFVPGIIANAVRSFDWLCFVILLHFTVGVSNAMSAQPGWHDYVQIALSVTIFMASMMSSRWLKYWHAAKAHTASSNDD